jgi:hypothetical protein
VRGDDVKPEHQWVLAYSVETCSRCGTVRKVGTHTDIECVSREERLAARSSVDDLRERRISVLWQRAVSGHEAARRELLRIAISSPHAAAGAIRVFEAVLRLPSWRAAQAEVGATATDLERAKKLLQAFPRRKRKNKLQLELEAAGAWLLANRAEPEHLVAEDRASERLGP